jgi:MscS family membrane protein
VISFTTLVVKIGRLALLVVVVAGRLADGVSFSQAGQVQRRRIDAALLRIVFRLVSVIVLAYLGIYAAEAVGIPIAPLVAGLGVGGLAIALAIRPTLENIIGGLTLFADRPVRVGDFCRYGDEIGTVEQIGLRSTRIRTLERTIVTVPNAEFSQMQLDNFAARDMRLLKTTLGLRYETTPDQLRYVLAELRKLLLGHPKVTPAPARVRFVGYGAYSLDVEIFAYLHCQDQDTFLAIQEDIYLRIADIVTEAGTGFAFPSQTTYLGRDGGVDVERGREAEAKVEDWREHNRLPFPEFDPVTRSKMEDTLDYPPRGAFDHQYRTGFLDDPPPEPQSPPEPEQELPRL